MKDIMENSMLKDRINFNRDSITNWLFDFVNTNYKNRPLTDHFWTIVYVGIRYFDVDVRSILGEEIWNHMVELRPTSFEFRPHIELNYETIPLSNNKKVLFDYHIEQVVSN